MSIDHPEIQKQKHNNHKIAKCSIQEFPENLKTLFKNDVFLLESLEAIFLPLVPSFNNILLYDLAEKLDYLVKHKYLKRKKVLISLFNQSNEAWKLNLEDKKLFIQKHLPLLYHETIFEKFKSSFIKPIIHQKEGQYKFKNKAQKIQSELFYATINFQGATDYFTEICPDFFNDIKLSDYLLESVPNEHKFWVTQHIVSHMPASIQAHYRSYVEGLLQNFPPQGSREEDYKKQLELLFLMKDRQKLIQETAQEKPYKVLKVLKL